MGGVARRATVINEQRRLDTDLILLSAGDFYARSGIAEMYRSRFLAGLMIDLDYTAVGLGEKELSYGLRAIKEDSEAGLPVICANLYEGGSRVFPPYIIKKTSGATIGIFSLLDERPKRDFALEIRDPVSEAGVIIDQLRDRCDYLILLAHMKTQRLAELLSLTDGIDLVIRGHAKTGADVSDDCAETLPGSFETSGIPVLFAGEFGKAVGMARVFPGAGGVYALSDTTLIRLTDEVTPDRPVAEKVMSFGESEGARIREMNLSDFLSRDTVTGKIRESYLGIDICRRCHTDIMSGFMLTKHFRAFNDLALSGRDTDKACLPCHTTGYGLFSGYDIETEQAGGINLQGVQCEACHGPGTKHSRDGKYKKEAVSSCRVCHTPERSPGFDFDQYMKSFDHCAHFSPGEDDDKNK
ncbi:MAG: hypothetical protein JW814_03590 [Candidatus Krumholzibacteriota bacterium]|nr:hypothetical protein [Candidatus Krumholzibacteriota bacterium]